MGKFKEFEEVITLGCGHSLMVNHIPVNLPKEVLSSKYFKQVKVLDNLESFGLYGKNIDYSKFAEDASNAEIDWKTVEFIEPMYRMLSEVIVNKGGWSPTDFSKNGVLKNSMQLLMGQSVYTDHYSSTNNVIGSVSNVQWQEAYTDTYKGKKFIIPAGIVASLKIDAVSNPKIARGILMDPPSVHSNSVTVRFRWEKSHPDMDDRDFWNGMGQYSKDGEMIRKVAIDIRGYAETSLVSNGADPFAKKLDKDGKIILPESASSIYNSFSEKNWYENKYYFTDLKSFGGYEDELHNTTVIFNDISTGPGTGNKNHKNEDGNMNELEKFLESIFGDGALSLSENQTATQEVALSAIKTLVTNHATVVAEVETLKADKVKLEEEITSLKADQHFVEIGKTSIQSLKDEVKADYIKLMGGQEKADEAILAVFESADLKALNGFKKSYKEQLDGKYPMSCKKCGSKEIDRSTSLSEDDEDEEIDEVKIKNTQDVISSLRDRKINGEPGK